MELDLKNGAGPRGQSRTYRMKQGLEDRAGPEGWSWTWRMELDL